MPCDGDVPGGAIEASLGSRARCVETSTCEREARRAPRARRDASEDAVAREMIETMETMGMMRTTTDLGGLGRQTRRDRMPEVSDDAPSAMRAVKIFVTAVNRG